MRVIAVVMVIWLFMAAPVAQAQTPTPEPGHGLPIPEVPNLEEEFDIPPPIGPDHPNQVTFWWDVDNLRGFLFASAASLWFIVNRTFYLWYAVLTFGLIMLAFRFFFRVRSGDMEIEGLGQEPLDNYVVPTEDEKWLM